MTDVGLAPVRSENMLDGINLTNISANPRFEIDSCRFISESALDSSLTPSVKPSIDNPKVFDTPIPTNADIIVVPISIPTTEKPTLPKDVTSLILTTAAIIIVKTNGIITIRRRLT